MTRRRLIAKGMKLPTGDVLPSPAVVVKKSETHTAHGNKNTTNVFLTETKQIKQKTKGREGSAIQRLAGREKERRARKGKGNRTGGRKARQRHTKREITVVSCSGHRTRIF